MNLGMTLSFPTNNNKKEIYVSGPVHEQYIVKNWYPADALPLIYTGPNVWLDSIVGYWCILPSTGWLSNISLDKPILVYFSNEEDATAYKLTWL